MHQGVLVRFTRDLDSEADGAGALHAPYNSDAADRMDLLTVVRHELGHVLGLDDLYVANDQLDLMFYELETGTRRSAADAGFAIL